MCSMPEYCLCMAFHHWNDAFKKCPSGSSLSLVQYTPSHLTSNRYIDHSARSRFVGGCLYLVRFGLVRWRTVATTLLQLYTLAHPPISLTAIWPSSQKPSRTRRGNAKLSLMIGGDWSKITWIQNKLWRDKGSTASRWFSARKVCTVLYSTQRAQTENLLAESSSNDYILFTLFLKECYTHYLDISCTKHLSSTLLCSVQLLNVQYRCNVQ
jgi:hypothetical protein